MLLVIDVGNTNMLFALHNGTEFVGQWRLKTDSERTADEYFVWLESLLRHAGLSYKAIEHAIISQVVPDCLFHFQRLCRQYFGFEILVVGSQAVSLNLIIEMDRPEEVGADRLVNGLAARNHYGHDLIVVDFGTATTFDVLDQKGAYIGGVITPGVNLSMAALYQAAAKLPKIALAQPGRVIGKSTIPAMQSGIYWGYVSMIEGMCRRIKDEHGRPMRVLATGGLCKLFGRVQGLFDLVNPDLTINGLVDIYRGNKDKIK